MEAIENNDMSYYEEQILQYRVYYKASNRGDDRWSLYASSSSSEGANAIIERKKNKLWDYKVIDSGVKVEIIKREIW